MTYLPADQRVALRYILGRGVRAEVIADPQDLLTRFKVNISVLARLEPLLPKMREAERILADAANNGMQEHAGA